MARRRFFVEEVRRGTAEISGVDAEHLVRVLRVEPGQHFELSDNRQVFLAEVETARKSSVVFRIIEQLPAALPGVSLLLYPALIKFDRFEWLVEKATELGATCIQPFAATRSERGLVEASRKRVERWRKIAVEASQQSRRDFLPQVCEGARSFAEIEVNANVRFVLDESSEAPPILSELPKSRQSGDQVAILVGPEGGWTEQERESIRQNGWIPCSLGPTILRAETAALAGLSILQAAWAASGPKLL